MVHFKSEIVNLKSAILLLLLRPSRALLLLSRLRQARLAVFLGGGVDEDDAAVRAGDGAAHEYEMIVRIDADDGEVAGGAADAAVTAGGLVPLLGPAETTVRRVRADRAGRAVHLL